MIPSAHFDEATILDGIVRWAGFESPTPDIAAVNRMMDLAAAEMSDLGAIVTRRAGSDGAGDVVSARFANGHGDNTPAILVMAHLDTVHPAGTLAGPLPIRRDGDRLFGPGVLDMKGGARIAIEAKRAVLASGRTPMLPVTFLFTPDEEVGSPSSRTDIEAAARSSRYVLVPEPLRANGSVVVGRHAIQRFDVKTIGQPSHAGLNKRDGRSAIAAMAALIQRIEALNDFEREMTYSVGTVHGGTFVNVVAIECRAEVLCVAPSTDRHDELVANMLALAGEHDGVQIEVTPTISRPVAPPHAATMALYDRARSIAAELSITLDHSLSGGGSDGNFTGALGIATLDGLGVAGAGAHTFDEHLLVSSLVPRCRILAELIATLD